MGKNLVVAPQKTCHEESAHERTGERDIEENKNHKPGCPHSLIKNMQMGTFLS